MTREEAINKIKWGIAGLIINKDVRDALETLIPELAESEDERIRKWLIELVKSTDTNHSNMKLSENCKLALAYLEKQKEQNSVPSRETILGIWELGNFWKENPEERGGLTQLQYIQKYWIEKCDYQKEQKPAEWSEEDERRRDGIIQWLREYQKEFDPKYDSLSIESIESLIDWLKSLRPSWKPSEEQMIAFDGCLKHWSGNKSQKEILESLYEKLKKL